MKRKGQRGLTLVELIVAFTIMAMLTAMAVPLARYKVRRDKERELVYALREIRKAIDDYKDASLAGKIGGLFADFGTGTTAAIGVANAAAALAQELAMLGLDYTDKQAGNRRLADPAPTRFVMSKRTWAESPTWNPAW